MSAQMGAELIRQALWTAMWVSLPLLAVALVAGIVIGLVQLVTSIQDPGFGTVPRLGAFLAAMVVFLPWMFTVLMSYTTKLFEDLGRYAR
ncbi:MAG: flagellar biosynthetic protein FliQ [Bryobacteraceae bacterium]|nr:flagellar biosynthetic protein FliQ [Bryobacteraceae bacterium]